MRRTLKFLSRYFKKHAAVLTLVTVLIVIGAGANVLGTYLVKPIVNNYIVPGDIRGLVHILAILGGIYLAGVAATYGYSQIMTLSAPPPLVSSMFRPSSSKKPSFSATYCGA